LRHHPLSNKLQISSNLLKILSSLDGVLDPVKEWFDPVIPTRKDFTSRCGCKMGDSNQNVSMCLLDNKWSTTITIARSICLATVHSKTVDVGVELDASGFKDLCPFLFTFFGVPDGSGCLLKKSWILTSFTWTDRLCSFLFTFFGVPDGSGCLLQKSWILTSFTWTDRLCSISRDESKVPIKRFSFLG